MFAVIYKIRTENICLFFRSAFSGGTQRILAKQKQKPALGLNSVPFSVKLRFYLCRSERCTTHSLPPPFFSPWFIKKITRGPERAS